MGTKSEITIGVKLHIAPIQYNFFEVWGEKKILLDDDVSETTYNTEVNKLRQEVVNTCVYEGINLLNQLQIPFEQEHLLSKVKTSVQNVEQQTISVDLTQMPTQAPTQVPHVAPVPQQPLTATIPPTLTPVQHFSITPNIQPIQQQVGEIKPLPIINTTEFQNTAFPTSHSIFQFQHTKQNVKDYDPANDVPIGIIANDFNIR